MANCIALLRGVNVGGHNPLAMSDLRDLFAELGFAGAKTLLQSGNIVFQSHRPAGAALERRLEKATAQQLNVSADYLVRSAQEWKQIVAGNPFPKEAQSDPQHLVAMFLKSAPLADVADLQAAIKGPEILRAQGRQLYIVYPAGIGRSKLTGTFMEQKLAVRGTARNWNTILKLAALCA